MAVNNSIGKIGLAIEKGIKAESKIDYGPVRNPMEYYNKPVTTDFTINMNSPNTFIMGIHKWGDTNNKVAP